MRREFNFMTMASYSFKLDFYEGHELKDGSYPVMLVVRKDNRRKTVNLGISAMPEQWDKSFQRYHVDKRKKSLHLDRDKLNKWLNDKDRLCNDIIKDFEEKKIDWTLNQFKDAFLNSQKNTSVEGFFYEYIEKLDKAGKIGNKVCYQQTLEMLNLYDAKFGRLVFSEIDKKFVENFNEYLQVERKCTGNTAKYYLKTLRSLINKAIKVGACSAANYPFGPNGFSISDLEQETKKRYLPNEYIEKLKTTDLEKRKLEYCRNLFLFSYYTQGMSYVDMARLTKKNILLLEGGKSIVYRRQKTEGKKARMIQIKLSNSIQILLDWFNANYKSIDDYLLPIISRGGYEGEQLYEHIRNRYRRYNKNLKELGEALGFEGIRLSSYMSRHSYAMRLKNSGIAEDIISEALGHKDLSTTKIYLDSFQKDEIAKANEVL